MFLWFILCVHYLHAAHTVGHIFFAL